MAGRGHPRLGGVARAAARGRAFDDEGDAVPALLSGDHERLGWEAAIAATPRARSSWVPRRSPGKRRPHGRSPTNGGSKAPSRRGKAPRTRRRSRRGRPPGARKAAGTAGGRAPPALARAGAPARSALRKPATLVAYAFDLVTPRARLRRVPRRGHRGGRRGAAAPRGEAARRAGRVAAARAGARRALGALAPRKGRGGEPAPDRGRGPGPRAAPRAAARPFSRDIAPAGKPRGAPVFGLSLGRPLAGFRSSTSRSPCSTSRVAPVAFERASRVLRSPFLAESRTEIGARARLDAALRRPRRRWWVTLGCAGWRPRPRKAGRGTRPLPPPRGLASSPS